MLNQLNICAMEKFEKFRIEKTKLISGGEFWDTGCENDERTDVWDDELERIIYL